MPAEEQISLRRLKWRDGKVGFKVLVQCAGTFFISIEKEVNKDADREEGTEY